MAKIYIIYRFIFLINSDYTILKDIVINSSIYYDPKNSINETDIIEDKELLLIYKEFVEINNDELTAIKDLINKRKNEILKEDDNVEGFNILINNGAIAGQTVFHLHFHLIARRKNDSSQENFFSNLGKARN